MSGVHTAVKEATEVWEKLKKTVKQQCPQISSEIEVMVKTRFALIDDAVAEADYDHNDVHTARIKLKRLEATIEALKKRLEDYGLDSATGEKTTQEQGGNGEAGSGVHLAQRTAAKRRDGEGAVQSQAISFEYSQKESQNGEQEKAKNEPPAKTPKRDSNNVLWSGSPMLK